MSTHFRQADTNESNSSNEKELGNGRRIRESQNNEIPFAKINNQMELSAAETPFHFCMSKQGTNTAPYRFPVETPFELNLSEEDIDAFLEST